jgi:hypothetical protein
VNAFGLGARNLLKSRLIEKLDQFTLPYTLPSLTFCKSKPRGIASLEAAKNGNVSTGSS